MPQTITIDERSDLKAFTVKLEKQLFGLIYWGFDSWIAQRIDKTGHVYTLGGFPTKEAAFYRLAIWIKWV